MSMRSTMISGAMARDFTENSREILKSLDVSLLYDPWLFGQWSASIDID